MGLPRRTARDLPAAPGKRLRKIRLVAVFYWMAVAALTLPLGLIALTSLTDSTLVGFPLGHPSLRWYQEALSDPANLRAFGLSASLALTSAVLAVIVGTWIALAAGMLDPLWRWLLFSGTLVPLVTPGIVHAISLRIAIRAVGIDPGPSAMLFGHVVHATPLAAIMISARLAMMPKDLLDAAKDLGAGPVRSFLHLQLAWLGPALAGAALLAGLNSFDDFLRSFFLGGYDPTLPVLIFGRLRSGLTPELNALATLALIVMAAVGGVAIWITVPRGRA